MKIGQDIYKMKNFTSFFNTAHQANLLPYFHSIVFSLLKIIGLLDCMQNIEHTLIYKLLDYWTACKILSIH